MSDSATLSGRTEMPVYIISLEVENVRCFGQRQTFSLKSDDSPCPAQWNLVLGDNGVGKTTLLQCLAWMRPIPTDAERMHIAPALSEEDNPTLGSLMRVGDDVSVNLKAVFSVGQYLCGNSSETSSNDTVTTEFVIKGKDGGIEKISGFPKPAECEFPQDIPVFGYGATRCTGTQKLDKGGLSDPLTSLYENFTELYDAEDILFRFDYLAAKNKREQDRDRLEKIKKIITSVLPDISCESAIQILGPEVIGHPDQSSGVRFETSYGAVPLSALSLGYQTTLTWVLDLALRLYDRYPDCPDPLSQPAIVLIDNIDLHLHPRWQRRLMEDLSTCFPAVQFVASAHSPLIAQAAENANLVVLQQHEGEVVINQHSISVNEWRADQILSSDLFDIPPRSRAIEDLMKQRDELLDEMNRTEEQEAELRSLEQRLEGLPTAGDPQDREAMALIRRVAESLKNNDLARQ